MVGRRRVAGRGGLKRISGTLTSGLFRNSGLKGTITRLVLRIALTAGLTALLSSIGMAPLGPIVANLF